MARETLRILAVEDSQADFRLLIEQLKEVTSVRFEIEHAEKLKDALSLCTEKKFDVVLSDLNLPDSRGLDTLEKICLSNPALPVIVLTGLDDEQTAVLAAEKNAQDYLVKGQIQGSLLLRSIRYAIQRKKSESERLRAEESLRVITERERFLADVLEYTSAPFAVGADDGSIIEFNKAFVDLTGYTRKELEQMRLTWSTDLTPPEWRSSEAKMLKKARETRQGVQYQKEYIRKDGSRVSIELFVQARFDEKGNFKYYYAFLTDITKRLRAEREFEKLSIEAVNEKNRLEAVMDSLPVGVAIIDEKGGNIRSNKMFEKIWGSGRPQTNSVNDYSAYKAWWMETGKLLRPGEWASAEALRTGKAVVGQLLRIERFEGSEEAFVINSAVPIFDAHNKIAGCVVALLDITETRRIEEAMYKIDEKYRLALEAAALGTWDYDVKKKFITWDERCRAIYGVESKDPVDYETFLMMVHSDDRDRINEIIQQRISPASAGKYDAEYRVIRPDGSVRWVGARGQVHFTGKGIKRQAGRFIGTVADITEAKKSEEILLQLNKTFKALGDTNQAMVRSTDEQEFLRNICRIINEDCGYELVWIGYAEKDEKKTVRPVAYAGFDENYIKGLNVTWADTERGRGPTGRAIRRGEIVVNRNLLDDPNFAPWRDAAVKRGYACSAVFPLTNLRGVFGALNIYAKKSDAFNKDEVSLLTELARDLAYGIEAIRVREEKSRATEALRQSEDRLGFAIDVAQLGTWDLDLVQRTSWTSSMHDAIFGHETQKTQCPWTYEVFLTYVLAEDRPLVNRKFLETIQQKKDWLCECRIRRRDGAIRWIGIKGRIQYDKQNHPSRMIGMTQDITERKNAEEILKRDKVTFENLVKEKTNELIGARIELEKAKRLSDIGTLSATVAHELRNPLAAIGLAIANVRRKAKDPNLEKHLVNIEKKISESDQIISNLLYYSRLKPPSYEKTDVVHLLEECTEVIRQGNQKHMAIVKKFGSLQGVLVQADPVQLKEVFANILNNAYDALPENGGRIEILGKEEGTWVQIFVKDNGIGIPESDLEKIFDPFYTTKAKGTGLGLSVCRQIVDFHQGSLRIESQPHKGASVVIRLPKDGRKNNGL